MFMVIRWVRLICIILMQGHILFAIKDYEGWIPITIDQALNVKRPYNLLPNYGVAGQSMEYNPYFREKAIQIVAPQSLLDRKVNLTHPEISRDLKIERDSKCKPKDNNIYKYNFKIANEDTKKTLAYLINISDATSHPEVTESANSLIKTDTIEQLSRSNKIIRRAKKLYNNNMPYEEYLKSKFNADISNEGLRKNYEVREYLGENDENLDESKITEHDGYFYEPSEILKESNEPNYTNVLSKILLKYNITSNDKLQNYALSKHRIVQNTPTPKLKIIPHRFNSLNHLPVDPILAVFLSNYGFYLPGVYGAEGNYKNLYGYLASNNIHNNGPFGLYKINSDTDSLSII